MSVSCCELTDSHFDRDRVRADFERYQKNGLFSTSESIVDWFKNTNREGSTLLDIGSGFGGVSVELLEGGLDSATLVDSSSAYLSMARELAGQRGVNHQASFIHGDAAELAEELPNADIVTLDRVVCCYPDAEGLISVSVKRASKWIALSYPRTWWLVRWGVTLQNALRRLKGESFRTFVHSDELIHDLLTKTGFIRRDVQDTTIWRTALYERQ